MSGSRRDRSGSSVSVHGQGMGTIFSEYLFLMGSPLQHQELYYIMTVVFEIFLWKTSTMGREVSGEGKMWAAMRPQLLVPALKFPQARGALFPLSAALCLQTGISVASLQHSVVNNEFSSSVEKNRTAQLTLLKSFILSCSESQDIQPAPPWLSLAQLNKTQLVLDPCSKKMTFCQQ